MSNNLADSYGATPMFEISRSSSAIDIISPHPLHQMSNQCVQICEPASNKTSSFMATLGLATCYEDAYVL